MGRRGVSLVGRGDCGGARVVRWGEGELVLTAYNILYTADTEHLVYNVQCTAYTNHLMSVYSA